MSDPTDVNQSQSDAADDDAGTRRSRRAMRQAERAAEREAILTGQQPLLTRRELKRLRQEAAALRAAVAAGEITPEQARALQDPLAEQPEIEAPAWRPRGATPRPMRDGRRRPIMSPPRSAPRPVARACPMRRCGGSTRRGSPRSPPPRSMRRGRRVFCRSPSTPRRAGPPRPKHGHRPRMMTRPGREAPAQRPSPEPRPRGMTR